MKNKGFFAKTLAVLALIALSAAVLSCGKNETQVAPFGSTIRIDPPGKSWAITPQPCGFVSYNTEMFTITVVGPDGDPMNNISMIITLDLAANSASTDNRVMQLYDGDPDNGGIPKTSPFETKTNSQGTKIVFVRSRSIMYV